MFPDRCASGVPQCWYSFSLSHNIRKTTDRSSPCIANDPEEQECNCIATCATLDVVLSAIPCPARWTFAVIRMRLCREAVLSARLFRVPRNLFRSDHPLPPELLCVNLPALGHLLTLPGEAAIA
jgi:hypothetical protein